MFDLQGYGGTIAYGALITLEVGLASLVLALLLGMLAAVAKMSSIAPLRWLAGVYTTVIRGIPDLVLMLLIFFGGQVLINDLAYRLGYDDYIDINPFVAGVVAIGFIFGAYMAETLRGAYLAVDKGQREAALAYGMRPGQVFFRVMLPQLLRHALPGLGNNWLVLLKTTALVSVIGLDDMVRKASLAAGATQMPFTFYLSVAVIFLVFTSISVWLLNLAETRLGRAYRRG
ncbi:ABC transporter permease [Balneatrix alpica]|uniref:ABC transporter permease n=1 Tax=Balneatrix alpica TaxID=75684 RepID=UPI0027384146|nr:ABC transporter permease [Balneatrix alpica]